MDCFLPLRMHAPVGAILGLGSLITGSASLQQSGSTSEAAVLHAAAGSGFWVPPTEAVQGGGLLAVLDEAPQHAKRALQALQGLLGPTAAASPPGTSGGNQAASGLAAWVLAVCSTLYSQSQAAASGHSARDGEGAGRSGAVPGSTGHGGAALLPLNAYPAAGALRVLVEALTAAPATVTEALASLQGSKAFNTPGGASASVTGATSALLNAASLLRTLAGAPRLPATDVGGPARSLLQTACSVTASSGQQQQLQSSSSSAESSLHSASVEVQVAVIRLAFAHGRYPPTGLTTLVDHLISPQGFSALSAPAKAALLADMQAALACLAPSRAAPAVTQLVTLALTDHTRSTPTTQSQPAATSLVDRFQLQAALWAGLTGIATMAAQAGKKGGAVAGSAPALSMTPELASALAAGAAECYAQLPPLPVLLPGERVALSAACSSASGPVHSALATGALNPASSTHDRGSVSEPKAPYVAATHPVHSLISDAETAVLTTDTAVQQVSAAQPTSAEGKCSTSSRDAQLKMALLQLWASAVRCLGAFQHLGDTAQAAAGAPGLLPSEMFDDAMLMSNTAATTEHPSPSTSTQPQHQESLGNVILHLASSSPPAHTAPGSRQSWATALRASQMRPLLVLAGVTPGGRNHSPVKTAAGAQQLAAVRAWCANAGRVLLEDAMPAAVPWYGPDLASGARNLLASALIAASPQATQVCAFSVVACSQHQCHCKHRASSAPGNHTEQMQTWSWC
jgi:hypothetical protein